MPKARKARSPSPEQYQVEVITAAKVNRSGAWDYYVKWYKYPEKDNSWEPQENLTSCQRLVQSFWRHIGHDNRDYPLGYQVYAGQEWVENEKEIFKREIASDSETSSEPGSSTEDEDDEEDVNNHSSRKLTIRIPPKKSPGNNKLREAPVVSPVLISNSAEPSESPGKPGPKVKLVSTDQLVSSSSLATKRKLFQNVASRSGFGSKTPLGLPPPPRRKNPLMPTGYKKNTTLLPLSSLRVDDLDLGAGSLINGADDLFGSPSLQDTSLLFEASDLHAPESGFPLDENTTSLDDLFPTLMPLLDDENTTPVVTTVNNSPKKWQWAGTFFINTTQDHVDKFCNITLYNLTEPTDFGRFLDSLDAIRLTRALNVADLDAILPSCGLVRQLAKLDGETGGDEYVLNSLVTFMSKRQQIAIMPLFLDQVEVASLLIFPSSIQNLCHRFQVPPNLRQKSTFVASLVPWTLTPVECAQLDIYKNLNPFVRPDPGRLARHASQILEFPLDLKNYISRSNRTYCVWWSPGDGTITTPGLETTMLHIIMKSCGAKDIGYDMDARIIFVHIAAVATLQGLPRLAERRALQPDVRFYTFGTHPKIPRGQWGVHAIYPLGGILTFTADALVEDPVGAAELMHQVAEHPFWCCYLLPSVIGMAATFSCVDTNPLSESDMESFWLSDVMKHLTEGVVSVLRAPPVHGNDPGLSWTNAHLNLLSLKPSTLLEQCLGVYSAQYSNVTITDLSTAMEAEILKDMLRMQTQPRIMENYRRYVIITSVTPRDSLADIGQSAFEWPTIGEFDFKDDGVKPHVDSIGSL